MHIFTDNAETNLTEALGDEDSDTTITVTPDGSADDFGLPEGRWTQLATLTYVSYPGEFEIVRIVGRTDNVFTVVRGQGGEQIEWPIGTKLSARITAGMLASFPQLEQRMLYATTTKPLDDAEPTVFALGDVLAVSRRRARMTDGMYIGRHDGSSGAEIVGVSPPCDLGVPETWSDRQYHGGSVVAPGTPDGFQYWLDLARGHGQAQSSASPTFNGDTEPTVAANGYIPSVGFWVPTAMPVELAVNFDLVRLVVTEVGFIAAQMTASTPPSVSIGSDVAATRFANAVELDELTSNNTIHRIPITTGGAMVEGLRFAVTTAATGGSVRGKFYWRGFFVEP